MSSTSFPIPNVPNSSAGTIMLGWFQPSPQLLMLCAIVRCLELLIHLLLVPISAIFVLLVVRTSVLHRNLKFILLCQCWCNLQYAVSRCIQILNKLLFNVDFFAQLKPVQMSVLFTELLGSMIGHVLLLERILATVFVSKYEHYKQPYFSIICFLIMTSVSLQNAYAQAFSISVLDVTVGTLFTLFATLGLSLAEIAIIFGVGYYNDNKYKLGVLLYHHHSLSERYQLSENIRTGRQLLLTFVFHFVNILLSSGITILFFYVKVQDPFVIDFLFVFVFSITAFCNSAIEVTVIMFHPSLSRRLQEMLTDWQAMVPFGAKVEDANAQQRGIGRRIAPKTIDGRELIQQRGQLGEQYFRMLRSAWT